MHTPIIKLTCILFALFSAVFCKLTAQITINDVLGDYITTSNHLLTNSGPITYTYTNVVTRFVYNTPIPGCDSSLDVLDSMNITGFHSSSWMVVIHSDSTFRECGTLYDYNASGKFYTNDSIYIKLRNGPNPDFYEYYGKKIITGIKELNLNDNLKIYPNPVSAIFTIELTNTNLWYKQSRVTIKNTLGQIVKTQELINKQQQMDVSNIPNGIYFIEVTTVKGMLSKKIMVSN